MSVCPHCQKRVAAAKSNLGTHMWLAVVLLSGWMWFLALGVRHAVRDAEDLRRFRQLTAANPGTLVGEFRDSVAFERDQFEMGTADALEKWGRDL